MSLKRAPGGRVGGWNRQTFRNRVPVTEVDAVSRVPERSQRLHY